MNKKMKRSIKILAATFSLAGLVTALGFGCGLGFQPIGLGGDGLGGSLLDAGSNGELVVVTGQRTTSVPIYTTIYNNYLSCLDVAPNNNTRTALEEEMSKFSDDGSALSVNSALLQSYVSLAAAVCEKKVNDERQNGTIKEIFTDIDLDGNPGNIDNAAVATTVNRIARSCWQRNEDSAELSQIQAEFTLAAQDANNNAQETRNLMLYLCTAMLASTSGYEM